MELKKKLRGRKVLLVVPGYVSYHCFLRELADGLGECGWSVAVACDLSVTMGQNRESSQEGKVEYYDLRLPRGAGLSGYLRAGSQLRRMIQRLRPDVMHAHFSAAILAAALAVREGDSFPTIGTFQGLQFPLAEGLKKRLYRLAEVFASKRVKGVWVLTEDDLKALEHAGVSNGHIQQAYGFGCRTDHFDPKLFSLETRRDFRQKWGISEEERVFTFVGRNAAFKGFPLVVRGFFRLLDSGTQARLLVVGDRDPLHPTGLTPAEEERLEASRAVIRCGWQKDVAPFLAITDALVHPSSREGMPVGCMEAASMGVRLIVSDGRGMRELLALTKQEALAEVTEYSVAAAMQRVCNNRDAKIRVDEEELQRVRRLLDRRAFVEEQIGIYERLLRSG